MKKIINTIHHYFNRYKKSINWQNSIILFVIIEILSLLENFTFKTFFIGVAVFFLITILVWIRYELLMKNPDLFKLYNDKY